VFWERWLEVNRKSIDPFADRVLWVSRDFGLIVGLAQ
jgi:hypothetical protein